MRRRRRFLATALAGGLLLVTPSGAAANGGSYIEFDRTHYLPGDAGVATSYVSVPRTRTRLFERGPFYLFAVPDGMLREGRPIPDGALRLATFTIEDEKGDSFELRAEFTAPQLDSGYYFMGLCNDPCTIAGFGDPLYGSVSIVATKLEGSLLSKNERLQIKLLGERSEARRAKRRLERVQGELDTQLAFAASERDRVSAEIEQLETQLAAARKQAASPSARIPFDPWVVGAITLVTLVAAALAFRRRRMLPVMTDL
jgi:hypothetical protein